MSVQRLQARLTGVRADMPGVRLAYLFGPRAHDPVGPMSDWDIALVARDADDARELASGPAALAGAWHLAGESLRD